METVAGSFLSFGIEKVWDLLVRESDRIKGVDEQLTELKNDLELLRSFLKDADAKKHANEMVKSCVEQIKEIAFDTEDIIETFLLKEELRKRSGLKQRMKRLSCITVDHRKVALDMEGISKRISKVTARMESFGVQQMNIDGREDVRLEIKQREERKTYASNTENNLVGLEETVKKLVDHLVKEDRIRVVSITGMGGIGKTTLARQVFNHEMVTNHFDGVVWVCLSQQFTKKYVWETIFKKLRSNHDEQKDSNMNEDELQDKLFQLLKSSNSLIVLDDMWKEEDWDMIKPMFPSKGCKILLTSRNEKVALHIDPNFQFSIIFKSECLSIESSWKLFQMTAFPWEDTSEYKVDEEMEQMGKQMIKHCGGLPLAIRLLGGLLAPQYTLSDWTRVYENIKSHIVRGTSFNDNNMSSVYHILRLSFEELPIYLKHAFLYLAHFPEDFIIDVETLAYYWAAEGVPRPRIYDGQTIREVGNGYIKELVNRNMVISEIDVETSRFEKCHLHDMMREVCLLRAEEENFQQIVHRTSTANSRSLRQSRRLVIHISDEEEYIQSSEMNNPKLRSLLFISKNPEELWMWKTSDLSFTRHQFLRLLDLSLAEFERQELPSSIGKLIHLRYLKLYFARVKHLPSSMQNLKKLLYLNLDVCAFQVHMPNILNGMRELAYLTLPEDIHGSVEIELGNLVNLETLKNFSTKNNNVKDLHTMTRLRVLSINIHRGGCTLETLSSSLRGIRTLEKLEIEDDEVLGTRYDEEKFVLDCVHLKQLKLKVHMPKLPDVQHFPSHLTTIYLLGCRLKEDPMPILGKLHQLKKVTLWYKSYCGRRMVCSASGFPQLEKLTLFGQEELEEWIVEEGSMPLLQNLTIERCPKLKQEADVFMILQKVLKLKEVIVRDVSFCGNRMVCSSGGFPQCQILCLRELYELEEWIVEEDSMPLLHTLYIKDCPKLKLPDGLRFITSLKKLYIDIDNLDMEKEWKERLSEGGEDYYKVQHIPCVELTKSWKWRD